MAGKLKFVMLRSENPTDYVQDEMGLSANLLLLVKQANGDLVPVSAIASNVPPASTFPDPSEVPEGSFQMWDSTTEQMVLGTIYTLFGVTDAESLPVGGIIGVHENTTTGEKSLQVVPLSDIIGDDKLIYANEGNDPLKAEQFIYSNLHVNELITMGTANPSLANLKRDIKPLDLEHGLRAFNDLEVVTFFYKGDPEDKVTPRIGIIADAESTDPIFLSEDRKAVMIGQVTWITAAIVKELTGQVKKLEAEVGDLKFRMDQIEQKLNASDISG